MNKQASLFKMLNHDGVPTFKPSVPEESRKRLSGQCLEIFNRLRAGRATNRELSSISLKYTSRISDIRQAGYDVRCVEHDKVSGLTVYELREGE